MSVLFWIACALPPTLCATAGAAPAPPPSPTGSTSIMPFKEVAAGMKGTGRTVFKGTAVEEFNVEILATMENILPKKNLILARLDGGPLRDTGILEGMSGSPVYINGRLVGAVSYAWGFAKEPICGITPIEEMLSIIDRGVDLPAGTSKTSSMPSRGGEPAPVSLLAWPERMVAFLRGRQEKGLFGRSDARGLLPASIEAIRPTLVFSGYSPRVAHEWFPVFESMSLHPVMAGSPSGPASAAASPVKEAPLTPGSAFGVTLVRGDLDMTAIGTVTWVDGDNVLGFGHPFLNMGATALPLTRAYVYGYFPSLSSSFKLASPLEEIGAITQDRFPGVAGRRGAAVKMVPIRVEMRHADGTSRSYRFDVVPDPLLTPGLLNLSLLSLLSSEEKEVGDISIRMREGSRIQISENLDVKLDNLYSGEESPLYAAGTVAYMVYLILNNEDRPTQIEGVNLLLDYHDEKRTARVDKIWLERYAAAPGETVPVHVTLQPFRGRSFTVDVPLKIPEETPEGKALLQVGDSLTLSRMEAASGAPFFVPRSLPHLIWLLNNIRANQKVYATLLRPDNGAFISGERLPSLPPSVSTVLLQPRSDSDVSARVRFRAIAEANAETQQVVRGYQKAILEIRR
jgi:hypothetical protein